MTTKNEIQGVSLHIEPAAENLFRLIFALDGRIVQEETISLRDLKSRLPEIGLRAMAHLGGDGSNPLESGAIKLGKILNILT